MAISSEWTLISRIREIIEKQGTDVPAEIICGIGDDCSVFSIDDKKFGLITTDISIENTHFKRDLSPPENIGYKAMVSNISDISAMGGNARYAFISIGIPASTDENYILSIYKGMINAANAANIYLAGGDTSRSDNLIINIAIYGEIEKNRLIKRSGALPGHNIYLTGSTGESMAGLEVLQTGGKNSEKYAKLVNRHSCPPIRYDIVSSIIEKYSPTSMIDISDGLLSDLYHICECSKTGFIIISEALPISGDLKNFSLNFNKDYFYYALESGEEYELLFTSPMDYNSEFDGVPVTKIGKITEPGYFIQSGDTKKEIKIKGFDHFRS